MRALCCVGLCAALGIGCAARQPLDIQGHRGARGLVPENTVVAFERALELGVDTLEMDVMLTADDVLVVHHDERLDPNITRTASGSWLPAVGPPVRSLTLAELRTFDVGRIRPGTAYAARFPDQQPRDGTRIPTLAEVLDVAERRSSRRTRYNIEIKTTPDRPTDTAPPAQVVDHLVAIVRARMLASRVTIQSFDWRALRRAREVAPELRRSCLTSADTVQVGKPGASPWTAGLDVDAYGGSVPRLVHAVGCQVWSPDHETLSAAQIREAHALGLVVVPWTVNTTSAMTRLIDQGVDGIITDVPDRVPRR